MRSGMSFEVKCVIETFTTEAAQISFDFTVTFEMTIQQSL